MEEIKENDENINGSSFDPNEDMPLLKPKRKKDRKTTGSI
jgi:hypothetical protein